MTRQRLAKGRGVPAPPAPEPLTAAHLLDLHAEFVRVYGQRNVTVTVVPDAGWWLGGCDLLRIPRAREVQYWIPQRVVDRLVAAVELDAPAERRLITLAGLPVLDANYLPRSFDGSPAELYAWLPYPRGTEP